MGIFVFSLLTSLCCPQDFLFHDDFSRHPEGSDGRPAWRPVGGAWEIRGGKLRQSAPGDVIAALARASLPDRFRLEAVFRNLSGFPGEGLLFNSRGEKDRPAPAQIVRVDPEGIYCGLLDAGGEFEGVGPVPAFVEGQVWNRLAVDADGRAGRYSVDLNGVRIARGLPLERSRGSFGLVAGKGVSEFALCSASPGEGGEPPRPLDLALTPSGDLSYILLIREQGYT